MRKPIELPCRSTLGYTRLAYSLRGTFASVMFYNFVALPSCATTIGQPDQGLGIHGSVPPSVSSDV